MQEPKEFDPLPESIESKFKRANELHKRRQREERLRVAREITDVREQDRKQWEFENGGKNPVSDDPLALDRFEHRMFEELGKRSHQVESKDDSTEILFIVLAGLFLGLFLATQLS